METSMHTNAHTQAHLHAVAAIVQCALGQVGHACVARRCRHGYTLFADLANRYTTDKLRFAKLDVGMWPQAGTVAGVEVSCVSSQLPSVITYERGQEERRVPCTRKHHKHIFTKCVCALHRLLRDTTIAVGSARPPMCAQCHAGHTRATWRPFRPALLGRMHTRVGLAGACCTCVRPCRAAFLPAHRLGAVPCCCCMFVALVRDSKAPTACCPRYALLLHNEARSHCAGRASVLSRHMKHTLLSGTHAHTAKFKLQQALSRELHCTEALPDNACACPRPAALGMDWQTCK